LKRIGKSLLGALVVTAISCLLLTLTRGIPTMKQLIDGGWEMFLGAFIVFMFYDVWDKGHIRHE
jgi:hypothetical protein